MSDPATSKVIAGTILVIFAGLMAFAIYALEPSRQAKVLVKYEECLERGGTITEDACASVKVQPANPFGRPAPGASPPH
jgi:hypothetical protein